MTRHVYTLLCALLLFGLGCCKTGTDGSPSRRNKLPRLSTPKSKPDTIRVSKATGGLPHHDPAVENSGLRLTRLPDVSVTCSAFDVVVRVKPSFYGFGADESELRLGPSCRSNGVLRPHGDLLFTYPLTACGYRQEGPRDFLVYKFTLHYEPSTEKFPSGASRIDVDIECRYQRYHHVYQLAVKPTWTTALVRKTLRGQPNEFQIHLMDDSWSKPVKNQVFHLGQEVNVQVSASRLPAGRRLYINYCYASPDMGSYRYTIIGNLGCMLDSKRDPGGASHFVSRANGSLRFSFKAFQFISDPDCEISIYCKVFATSKEPSPAQKSCTYGEDRWQALSGDDSICKCCDSQCTSAKSKRMSSVSSSLLVSDQPLVAEEGLLHVGRLDNPLLEDLLQNEGEKERYNGRESVILEEKKKKSERGSREFTEVGSGDEIEEEEFKGAKRAVQEDEIKGGRMEHILASQRNVPPSDSNGDEGIVNPSNGTQEATKTQSSDVRNNQQADDQELTTWYFTWT
ncbi:zona pellucida sperm-binding protein 3 isoform X2 [Vanacampus margaritifer]